MKLTPATARDLQPSQKLRDHEVKGLQLIAGTTGKSWHLYYRTRAGVERRPKIGSFPEMALSAARSVAKEMKDRIALGEDPSADWQEQRTAPTVTELCDRYLTEWAPKHNKPRTIVDNTFMIERHIKPGLGHKKVAGVTRADVDSFLLDVLNRKYVAGSDQYNRDNKAKAPSMVNHVRTLLTHLFNLARSDFGLAIQKVNGESVNPVAKTAKQRVTKRRRMAEPDELPRLFAQLHAHEAEYPAHVACLWAMLFSGGRVSEIERATKAQFADGRLVLRDHKTADYIGDKAIELPGFVVEKINALKTQGERLFGDIGLKRVWEKIRTAAGCPDLQMLDLRRTFASYAHGIGYTLEQIGGWQLGHTDPRTTRGYAWMIDGRAKQMVEKTSASMLGVSASQDAAPSSPSSSKASVSSAPSSSTS